MAFKEEMYNNFVCDFSNNLRQKIQDIEIINEINTLPTIKDKDNMTSTYRKIMNRINTALSDVNTINVLCCYALTIFNSIK